MRSGISRAEHDEEGGRDVEPMAWERGNGSGSGAAEEPIAGFELNGRRFLVCPCKTRCDGGERVDAVGSLTLEGRTYYVVERADPVSEATLDRTEKLTARELQIATLVARGRCTKRIACDLHISEWTVQTHLRRMYGKLGVTGRAEMVFLCAKRLADNN
jgi:DNA-binding CsgD family transcriptional regulator